MCPSYDAAPLLGTDYELAPPRAESLLESLRAFGYSPEMAIADLVDNSITAKAANVWVHFQWGGEKSWVSVRDDGVGMSEAELSAAMRPGSMSPLQDRGEGDLGRFGLGLKTASLSQARELTVVSRSPEARGSAVRRWDLDVVAGTGEWRLLKSLPAGPVPGLPDDGDRGTTVLWTKCDRLVGSVPNSDGKARARFMGTVERVQQHLGMTFHRFLTGRPSLKIWVNGDPVRPWDPFLTGLSMMVGEEVLNVDARQVKVSAWVLPHRSKLTDDQARSAGGARGWTQMQGFYVYRDGRLISAGTWLNLGLGKDEHTKLARVAVEFPKELDHRWQIDVKKATVHPPGAIVEDLRRIARAVCARAQEVYRFRGKIAAARQMAGITFAWEPVRTRDGLVYRVNRKHPVVTSAVNAVGRKHVERLLRFVEETVPATQIGVDIAASLDNPHVPFDRSSGEIAKLFRELLEDLLEEGYTRQAAIDRMRMVEPFDTHPEVIAIAEESHP